MAMRSTGGQELVTRDEPVRVEVYGEFARIQEAEKKAATAITMLALVDRVQSKVELLPPEDENKPVKLVGAFSSSPAKAEGAKSEHKFSTIKHSSTVMTEESVKSKSVDVKLPLEHSSVTERDAGKKTTSDAQDISVGESARGSMTDDNESFPL